MRKFLILILFISCCPNKQYKYLWYCDNHREYIGDHNFGKGHLCDDEHCRRSATRKHDCVGWRSVKVETN